MQPVHSVKNQYVGINAHLHSFWQDMHLWHRFHNVHITLLSRTSLFGSCHLSGALGETVAWVELLSPTNKGVGLDARIYRDKRTERLHNSLGFVEIDYLHETPPAFWGLADCTNGELDSHAYRILIFDPRPTLGDGIVQLGEFDVGGCVGADCEAGQLRNGHTAQVIREMEHSCKI